MFVVVNDWIFITLTIMDIFCIEQNGVVNTATVIVQENMRKVAKFFILSRVMPYNTRHA